MNHLEYNGWHNYETWAVNLWLSNEQTSSQYWSDAAREAIKQAPKDDRVPKIWTADEAARFNLADQLKSELEDMAPDLGATLWADLLNAAMSEVNWAEIAAALIEAEATA